MLLLQLLGPVLDLALRTIRTQHSVLVQLAAMEASLEQHQALLTQSQPTAWLEGRRTLEAVEEVVHHCEKEPQRHERSLELRAQAQLALAEVEAAQQDLGSRPLVLPLERLPLEMAALLARYLPLVEVAAAQHTAAIHSAR
jgi:hypothetical protein